MIVSSGDLIIDWPELVGIAVVSREPIFLECGCRKFVPCMGVNSNFLIWYVVLLLTKKPQILEKKGGRH